MSGFRFVHAADLHLDTPFEGLREAAPDVRRALRDASLAAFDALVDLCLEVDAAFLLIAGDVYDGAERGLRAQLRFRAGLDRLSRAGVGVFVVHGNHDPTEEGWSAIRDWPEGTRVFGCERVESVPVERDGERIATVYGISYPRRDVHENLALAFPRRQAGGGEAGREDGGLGLRVALLHCNAGGHAGHAPYAACSVGDLSGAAVDYWALGHVHTRQVLCESPWIVYPGNLQGRSPHPGEQGEKGAVVVDVEGGRVAKVGFRALDRVRFLSVELDVGEHGDLGAVERALQQRADDLRDAHPDRALVLGGRLTGRSALRADLSRAGSLPELLESLRDTRRGQEPLLWWSMLSSDVGLPIDRDAVRAGDDFYGQLLALADELAERPGELRRFAREAFAELPDELRGVALPPPDDLARLLVAAEQTALESVGDLE